MDNSRDILKNFNDQTLDHVRRTQEAVVDAVRSVNDTVGEHGPDLSGLPQLPVDVDRLVDSTFAFAQTVLDINHRLAHRLLGSSHRQGSSEPEAAAEPQGPTATVIRRRTANGGVPTASSAPGQDGDLLHSGGLANPVHPQTDSDPAPVSVTTPDDSASRNGAEPSTATKATTKKATSKKATTKKTTTRTTKKAPAKKTATKKAATQKRAAKKTPAKAATKKATTTKATTKKSAAKKAPTKKATAKKTSASS